MRPTKLTPLDFDALRQRMRALEREAPDVGSFVGNAAYGPVEIAGVEVPEGARLMLLLASANRDESIFENPDEFDIRRENAGKHIAFSHGIHFCLGAPLARLEARIAFELLMQRLPDLKLSPPDQTFEFDPNMSFRGPKEMWVEWAPDAQGRDETYTPGFRQDHRSSETRRKED